MAGTVKPIPEGYHTVTPYLIVNGGAAALDFYSRAFGAVETFRMPGAGGKIGHAEIRIGQSMIMLADEHPGAGALSPATIGGSPVKFHLYVEDIDRSMQRALDAGATLVRPVQDQFYGDRTGGVQDPFGYQWYFATHIEDVAPEEMKRRAQAASAAAAAAAAAGA